jgi:uncharacterized membrane protein
MKKFNLKEEIVFWVLLVVPWLYLTCIWKRMPATVPVHFNIDGVADSWDSKTIYIWVLSITSATSYLPLFLVSGMDTERPYIEFFNSPFSMLRLMVSIWICIICLVAVHSAMSGSMIGTGRFLIAPLFLGFAVYGKYAMHLKFLGRMGINSPWTLNNETVWKQAHLVLGRVWLYGGLLCFVLSFIFTERYVIGMLTIFAVGSVGALIIYPWILYRREERKQIKGNS